jgi:predicted amidophosphoribosyltransferase
MVAMAPLVGAVMIGGSNKNAQTTADTTVTIQSQTVRVPLAMPAVPQNATHMIASKAVPFDSLSTDYSMAKYDFSRGPVAYRSGGTVDPLTNGVPVTGFLNGTGDSEMWYINVSSGARYMRIVLAAQPGNYLSVYGRLNTIPTTSSYDWSSTVSTSIDLSRVSPVAGQWYMMVYSQSGKGTYLLTVTVLYSSTPQPLTSEAPATGSLNATADSDLWYIDVSSGATSMRCVLTCPSGTDFDVYGRLGSYPDTKNYDWRGNAAGNEDFSYGSPGAGRWYIMPYSYFGNGSYELTVIIAYPPVALPLSSGVTVTGSLNASGDYELWYIYVNSGATMIHAVLSCPSGADFDLYGMFGSYPTTSNYNWCGVTGDGEDVTYSYPNIGYCYIMVTSYSGNGTYQLTVTVTYVSRVNPLTSGSAAIGMLNMTGASDMWYIYVSGVVLSMRSVLTCSSGTNFDLYGACESYPTTSSYYWCGVANGGEDVTYSYPSSGYWYIMVNSQNGSGTYQLVVTLTYGSGPGELHSGTTVTSILSGNRSYELWYIYVNSGASSMHSVLTCPTGCDFDLYGKYGSYPSTSYCDWSGTTGHGEDVTYSYPSSGYWYIMVNSYSGNGTYSLTVTIDYGGQVPVDPTALLAAIAVIFIVIFVFIILVASSRGNTLGSGRGSNYLPSRAPNQLPLEDERERQQLAAVRMLQCRSCGASLKPGDNNCWNCGAPAKASLMASSVRSARAGGRMRSGICMVCKRGLEKGDEILFCPYCGGLAHKDHMLEWLHVKDYCPTCGRHLDEAEVRKQTEPESGRKSKRRRH